MTWVSDQQLRPFGRTSRPLRRVRVARSTGSSSFFLVLTNLAAFFIDLALLDGDLERIMAMGGGWHRRLGLGVGHYRASTGCTHPTPSRHG